MSLFLRTAQASCKTQQVLGDRRHDPEASLRFVRALRPRLLYIAVVILLSMSKSLLWVLGFGFRIRPEDLVPSRTVSAALVIFGIVVYVDWKAGFKFVGVLESL